MQEEETGGRVERSVEERQTLGVVADERDVQLARQDFACAGDVVGREIDAVELGLLRERRAQHAEEVAGAAGDVEHPQRLGLRRARRPREADHRRNQTAPHRVGGAAEEQLDLEIVQSSAGVTEIAFRLIVKIARVVPRIAFRVRDVREIAPADARARARQIEQQTRHRLRVLAPRHGLDQFTRVQSFLGVLPVLFEQLADARPQRSGRLGRGRVAPAEQRPRVRDVGVSKRDGPRQPALHVHLARELARQSHAVILASGGARRNH